MKLEIETTADSRWGTNSYLVEDVDTHDAVVIDANMEPEDMLEVVRRRGGLEQQRDAVVGRVELRHRHLLLAGRHHVLTTG